MENQTETPEKLTAKEYGKIYYANNKERILQSITSKVVCSTCNKSVSKQHLKRHRQTSQCRIKQLSCEPLLEELRREINDLRKLIKTEI
jgi:Na+/phosphate symporter